MENHWLKQILNPGPGKDDCPAMFGEPNEQLLNTKASQLPNPCLESQCYHDTVIPTIRTFCTSFCTLASTA